MCIFSFTYHFEEINVACEDKPEILAAGAAYISVSSMENGATKPWNQSSFEFTVSDKIELESVSLIHGKGIYSELPLVLSIEEKKRLIAHLYIEESDFIKEKAEETYKSIGY